MTVACHVAGTDQTQKKSEKNMSDNRFEHLYSSLIKNRTANLSCPRGDLNPSVRDGESVKFASEPTGRYGD